MAEAQHFCAASDGSTTETMRGNIMYYLSSVEAPPPITQRHALLVAVTDKEWLFIKRHRHTVSTRLHCR